MAAAIPHVILWHYLDLDYSNIRRSADCLVLGMTVCISHSKLLCPNCSNIQHVKLFQYSISLLSRPNYKPGSANGTLVMKIVGDSKRGRRVELAIRASGIASHAPRIRPKIAAILACNIVTALSQCRHVRLWQRSMLKCGRFARGLITSKMRSPVNLACGFVTQNVPDLKHVTL